MQTPTVQTLPLRDIKLPAEPGFWPLAPGWWAVAALVLLVTVWVAIKWYKHHQKKRRWLAIDQQLSDLEFAFRTSKDEQKLLTDVSMFLRRFVKFQLHQVAASSLAGHDWIEHLNQQQPGLFDEFEMALARGIYASHCEYNPQALLKTTRQFVRQQVMRPSKIKHQEAAHV